MSMMRAVVVCVSVMTGLWACSAVQPTSGPEPTQDVSAAALIGTTSAVCGDGVCAPSIEDCGTCPGDCPCWQEGTVCSNRQCVPICGDGICSPSLEDCGTCPVDCTCPDGEFCQNRQCTSDPCAADPVCCGDICCLRPWKCGGIEP